MALQDMTNPMQGVSGPGKFAKRTDLEYQAPEYGAGAAYEQQVQGAPLAKSPDVRPAEAAVVRDAAAQAPITPLYAPTQRPNEPVTHGADVGAGAGSDILQMRQPDDSGFTSTIREYMPVISYIASLPSTSPETRQILRQLRDQL